MQRFGGGSQTSHAVHHVSRKGVSSPGFLTKRVDAYQRDVVAKRWQGGRITQGLVPGPGALIVTSNDYLSIGNHPSVIDAQVEGLKRTGHGLLQSGVFRNGEDELGRFERELAALLGTEDALACQSGWNANVGLIQSIAGPDVPVYIDLYAHASLWEGIVSAGAVRKPFRHNRPESLANMIERHGPGVVCVDAVYSTNGELCPLEEIVSIANAGGCAIIVDESHSLGVFGKQGEGLTSALGLADRVHFRTASLSKAFASRGGIILGTSRYMDFLRFHARPAIFSSGMLPFEAAGYRAALGRIMSDDWRRAKLWENASYLRSGLTDLGYNMAESECQIISLIIGTDGQTMAARDALQSRGIFGSVFAAPATPLNRSLIRFSVQAEHEKRDLDRIITACAEMRDEVNYEDWISSRQRARSSSPISVGFSSSILI